jgi:hypothetical protein
MEELRRALWIEDALKQEVLKLSKFAGKGNGMLSGLHTSVVEYVVVEVSVTVEREI